jgi:Raf kinase inhibitor-like YbhB/YbcL family protein
MLRPLLFLSLTLLFCACNGGERTVIKISSSAFEENALIPVAHTADGKDSSPPLTWSGAPEGTRSWALICDDPDAPRKMPWVHWVLFNVPADRTSLPEGVSTQKELSDGTRQGTNDFGKIGYGGPSPPKGKPHRYFFKLNALDTMLNLPAGATKEQLLAAMKGHVLAEAQCMGRYGR